jgi:hypothetical protein
VSLAHVAVDDLCELGAGVLAFAGFGLSRPLRPSLVAGWWSELTNTCRSIALQLIRRLPLHSSSWRRAKRRARRGEAPIAGLNISPARPGWRLKR